MHCMRTFTMNEIFIIVHANLQQFNLCSHRLIVMFDYMNYFSSIQQRPLLSLCKFIFINKKPLLFTYLHIYSIDVTIVVVFVHIYSIDVTLVVLFVHVNSVVATRGLHGAPQCVVATWQRVDGVEN